MTLYRQLLTSILGVFLLLAVTIPVLAFSPLKSHIQHQAISRLNHDLDIAEVALKPLLALNQGRQIATAAEQLFGATNWQHLAILLHQSGQSITHSRSEAVSGIPEWFLKLNLFSAYTDTRLIYDGLVPQARISITTDPAALYHDFWQTGISLVNLTLITLAAACAIILAMVKRRFRPLGTIEQRATQIRNNQFGNPIPLPAAGELRTIVKVINHLSAQLDNNFKVQAREAVKLREQAYRDNVSGLGNRTFFINQLNSWLSNSHKGGLAIMKTAIIEEHYRSHGFADGDLLVSQIANDLNEAIIANDISLARLSYDEFALLAPNVSAEKLKVIGESMLAVIENLQQKSLACEPLPAQVGLVMNNLPSTSNSLLSQLDNALAQAALNPSAPLVLIDAPTSHASFGKQQWKSILIEAIDNDFFSYHFQPVISENDGIYQHEVFTAIKKNQQVYTAGQFLGAIEDLGIGSLFDRHVIAQLINRLNADQQFGPLAINITNSSISDPAFIRWLTQVLEKNQALSSRLFFELPESSFIRSPDSTSLLCAAIHCYHFRFGVDNYGRHFKSLDYLQEFRPDYVKIDFVYTHQLNDQTKSEVLSSISRTAHSLNIMTIATRVETETQLERLSELFVSGFQGYIVERPNKQVAAYLHCK